MTLNLDEILNDPTAPKLTRLEEARRDRDQAVSVLAKLDAGAETFSAVGRETLSANNTTEANKARLRQKIASSNERIKMLEAERVG